jgi:hypothetical protein
MGPITDAHKIEYGRNVQLAVQQKRSRFEQGFTYHDDWKGRVMIFEELMGSAAAIINGPRGGDTPNIEQNHEPVWVTPTQIEWGKLIEKEDAIKALTDYESPYVQSGAAAIVRGRDLIFATALLGSRIIGLDGTTTSAYSNPKGTVANTVGSSDGNTTVGMNIRKVQRAKRLLRSAYVEVDYEDLWCALNAQGMEELFNDILTINTDEAKMAYIDKDTRTVQRVAGVNFVSYESIPDIDASNYAAVLWCKSAMHYGDFDPLQTSVEPNPAKKYRLHPYMENWFGATRSEDVKVIKVLTKI